MDRSTMWPITEIENLAARRLPNLQQFAEAWQIADKPGSPPAHVRPAGSQFSVRSSAGVRHRPRPWFYQGEAGAGTTGPAGRHVLPLPLGGPLLTIEQNQDQLAGVGDMEAERGLNGLKSEEFVIGTFRDRRTSKPARTATCTWSLSTMGLFTRSSSRPKQIVFI
jgi:hypothetical protein